MIGYNKGEKIENNVAQFLEQHAKKISNKKAFIYYDFEGGNKHITYGKLNEYVAKFGSILKDREISKGDRVIVFFTLSVELYIAVIALQRIGAIPVLIDSVFRANQLGVIVKNSTPSAIVSSLNILKLVNSDLEKLGISNQIEFSISGNKKLFDGYTNANLNPVNGDETALITYTTGSSGIPKGVDRTHKFLAAQHYALKRIFPYKEDAIDLPIFPVFALNNIASGVTTVIPNANIELPKDKDITQLISQITEFDVNCMTLSPTSFKRIAAYCLKNNIKLKKIDRVLTGGAPISEHDAKNFIEISPDSKNYILYGSTEVEPISYIESRDLIKNKQESIKNKTQTGVNVGKIDCKLRYNIINIDGSEKTVESGEIGELIVSGEHVCNGYYNNKKAFEDVKILDDEGVIWHKTGDLVRVDMHNNLWVVGRKHNIVVADGEMYFPVRPEIALKDIGSIVNSAYLNIEIDDKNSILAVVTTNSSEQIDIRKKIIKKFKKEGFPLDIVVFMDDIPMDVRHHSKVDYHSLRKKLDEYL